VVPAFIKQALLGVPLTIFGNGNQTRSFCFVSDLIRGIFALSQSDWHEPVNIGNPREMTVNEFARKILELTGSQSVLEYHPLPVDDPRTRQPDITQARNLLKWEPQVPLEEGLALTIAYFRRLLETRKTLD
jgi:dTDP-glucose 4,6-dehydratase